MSDTNHSEGKHPQFQHVISQLKNLPIELEKATTTLDQEKLRKPEKVGKWSVLEVIQHLADTELVYGYRIRMILSQPQPAIQAFDQDLWAKQLRYNEVAPEDALHQLRALRAANVRLIRTLDSNQLHRIGIHSERGAETVETIVRMMAAHDQTHLRQIARIKASFGAP